MPTRAIVVAVKGKVAETIEQTDYLAGLAPVDRLDWRPELSGNHGAPSDLGHLLGHLLDCLAGFCAAFQVAFPDAPGDLAALRALPVNHRCLPDEARARIQEYARHITRSFDRCTDGDLARVVPTVFAVEGETLATLLLGNLEHLTNHKYQLFFYLKLLGVPVSTSDLYRLRGFPGND